MGVGSILPAHPKCDEGVTFGVRGARALVDVAQQLFDDPAREVSDLESPVAVSDGDVGRRPDVDARTRAL
jgi:hypothetical protein